MTWFVLALTAAVSTAAEDTCISKILRNTYKEYGAIHAGNLFLLAVANTVSGLAMGVIALLTSGLPTVTTQFWVIALLCLVFELIGHVCNSCALAMEDYSAVGPIVTTTPLFVIVLAYFFLGEHISFVGCLGIIAIVAGCLWLASGASTRAPKRSAVALMLVTALIWAVVIIGQKIAIAKSSSLVFGAVYVTGMGLAAGISCLLSQRSKHQQNALQETLKYPKEIKILSAVMVVSCLCHYIGIMLTQAAYFMAVKRLKPLFIIPMSRLILGEQEAYSRFAPVIVMIIGVLAIVLGQ